MLDAIHARLHDSPFLYRFTAFTRIVLAIGFIPQGIKKVLGIPFTILPASDPVGYFFDAFFQAGEFYAFVGASQAIAGLLLLFPRTATLGAVIFTPIILNVSVITLAVGFRGTWLITLLMTLACLYLLCWDYDRLKSLLPMRKPRTQIFRRKEYLIEVFVWAIAGMAIYGILAAVGVANLWANYGCTGLVLSAFVGLVFGSALAWHLDRMPPLTREIIKSTPEMENL